jgi:hypothetical protein
MKALTPFSLKLFHRKAIVMRDLWLTTYCLASGVTKVHKINFISGKLMWAQALSVKSLLYILRITAESAFVEEVTGSFVVSAGR